MWDSGSLINETPITSSVRMFCTVEALLLCGIWALLSIETPIQPSGRMVCTREALLQCGISALVSVKHEMC